MSYLIIDGNCGAPSLYGNYRQRKFSDIYPDFATFKANYKLAIPTGFLSQGVGDSGYSLTDTELTAIYCLLYSRYGNSTISSSDENRFKFEMSALIFQYAPLWLKKLDIQVKIRKMDLTALQQGSFAIHNHAYNPSTLPSTSSTTELTKIDDQNTSRWVKSPTEAYSMLLMLLDNDPTEDFLRKFRKLFLIVVQPELPLWYENEMEV